MPCVLGYAEIGRKNKKIKPIKRMYREWLNTYSGKEYQKVSKNVGKLYDEATISRLGINFINTPKWKKMISTFKTATLLEIDFGKCLMKRIILILKNSIIYFSSFLCS